MMIDQIIESNLYKLDNPIYIGMLPNNGNIIEGYPQAILTFDETNFKIYTFQGIRKYRFNGDVYDFSFVDITEIEMGKYNFKNLYIKIGFSESDFIAFQYFLKVKGHEKQQENINKFIEKLESIATVVE